ncbi:hypothetical protein PLESTB_000431000 [Pleodorina starrii]|uniref:Uncharacterized protein n=1 Tax=Pleodorina starrii TaxID=330485 RepID=A0A9W6BET1_9CHLO|nr:hypothetical protein PLESTM_001692900 [Pleodorina starrii]GLC50779.1 hypothetical protein PLESTB_000431000 [Pleodorina starrii]
MGKMNPPLDRSFLPRASAGAVFEQAKPVLTSPDDYRVTFTPITPPGNPGATIRAGNTAFAATALQMRQV